MKKLFTPSFIMMIILAVVLLLSCKEINRDRKYKVHYNAGTSTYSDYTDNIEHLPNGGIKYVDECGAQIERFGTFSIQKLK